MHSENDLKGDNKMKKEVFGNIIGYEKEKIILKRIIDVLTNQEKYKKLGVKMPHGLLLYGKPGIGKTSISYEIIDNLKGKRNSFVIRKTKSDGDFINHINSIFERAKKEQPSLILLDDLDKFAEDDNSNNNEEFVAVQSLMDDVKKEDIFIIATANNINVLPKSLQRSGRFDIKIELLNPEKDDMKNIIEFYLKNKKISKDVNIQNLAYILDGASCADLEKICNQAGIYAGYKDKKEIGMEELVIASLEWAYDTSINDINEKDKYSINIAYHEAGHALIGMLLEKKLITFVTVVKNISNTKGFTKYQNDDNYFDDIKFMENRIKVLLGGKAATEIVYNKCDTGSNTDIHRAFDIAERFTDHYCKYGFNSWVQRDEEVSEKVKQLKDERMAEILNNYYKEVIKMLLDNREKLDVLAKQINKKKILFQDEIEDIYNNPLKYKEVKRWAV